MSVAGEVGIGIRSPAEESWPLLLCEGGDVGPSLLADNTKGKTVLFCFVSASVVSGRQLNRGTHECQDWRSVHVCDQELMQGKTWSLGSTRKMGLFYPKLFLWGFLTNCYRHSFNTDVL